MPSVVVAHTWRGFPFCPTSFLAGIQTIPQELYEATPVDGASRWQQFCYITLSGLYHLTFTVPFCAWMFIGYFRSLPSKLEEPAMVDDYTKVRALFRILLPLPAPALVAPAIFSFTLAWTGFLLALMFTMDQRSVTVAVTLSMMVIGDQYIWGQLVAGAVLASIPVGVLYSLGQRFVVHGLAAGAVKG